MTTVQLALSHHWRVPAHVFGVRTSDDVLIVGTRLGDHDPERPAMVLVHGLMGWHAKPKFAVFAEHLTEWFTVYAFDMRGHGGSAAYRTSAAPRSTTSTPWWRSLAGRAMRPSSRWARRRAASR